MVRTFGPQVMPETMITLRFLIWKSILISSIVSEMDSNSSSFTFSKNALCQKNIARVFWFGLYTSPQTRQRLLAAGS